MVDHVQDPGPLSVHDPALDQEGEKMLTVADQLLCKIPIAIMWLLHQWPKFLQVVLVPSQQLAMQYLSCLPGMLTETLLLCLPLLLLLLMPLLVQQLHLALDPIVHGAEIMMKKVIVCEVTSALMIMV